MKKNHLENFTSNELLETKTPIDSPISQETSSIAQQIDELFDTDYHFQNKLLKP
ncbi:MAG TPA: hypothetical protein PLQ36_00155 [Candidatus Gracilibacteria bacterium]|nr:hypothetical protein [Candidatus Gracilibacteria bacterium]